MSGPDLNAVRSTGHPKPGWRSYLPSANALLLIAILNAFILSLGGSALLDSYHQFRSRTQQSAQDLSTTLTEGVSGLFDRIDFSLMAIGDSLKQSGLNAASSKILLQSWRQREPMVEDYWIIDAKGHILFTGKELPDRVSISLADRDYFVHLRDDEKAGMTISKPLVGRLTQQWVIVLARRLSAPDGSFAGIVMATMPVSKVAQMFSSLHLGANGAVAMRADDLSVMARFPETVSKAPAVGKTAVSQQLLESIQANPQWGNYVAKAGIDGIERFLSYRRVGERPVYIVVGLATTDTMTEWRRSAMPLMAGLMAFVLLTLVGGAVISRIWRQRTMAYERLRLMVAEQEQFSEILAHHLQEPVRIQHIFAQRLKTLLPEPLNSDQALTLEHVLRGASRLRALLRDVRIYLNLEEMLHEGEQSCDSEAVISYLLQSLDEKLTEAGAQLAIGELPAAPIGDKPFAVLMRALIENAIDYRSPDRPLVLHIDGGRTSGLVFFAVTDNGRGIPPEFRERVFNVFERLNPQTEQSGTGIGLAIVRKIVHLSEGKVEITDGEDGGIRVAVYFPDRLP